MRAAGGSPRASSRVSAGTGTLWVSPLLGANWSSTRPIRTTRSSTCSASASCPSAGFSDDETDAAKRPSVQVGDPFEEKRLIEACLAMLDANLVVGIQDLGGAGLTCATSETASRGGVGMDVYVSEVAKRQTGMEPFEVMTSESQERMLAIVEPGHLDAVLAICERWEITATVVGTVTAGGALRILDRPDGEVLAAVPAASLHEDAPLLDRPRAEPADRAARLVDSADVALDAPADPGADLLELLCDTSWVWSQYDHQLFLNTVVGPGGEASVLRLKHPVTGDDTGRGLAVTCDGNHRWCALDPRRGAGRRHPTGGARSRPRHAVRVTLGLAPGAQGGGAARARPRPPPGRVRAGAVARRRRDGARRPRRVRWRVRPGVGRDGGAVRPGRGGAPARRFRPPVALRRVAEPVRAGGRPGCVRRGAAPCDGGRCSGGGGW